MNIKFKPNNNSDFYDLEEKIIIKLENTKFPFGLDNNSILKCNIITKYYDIFENIEKKLGEYLSTLDDEYSLKSQLIITDTKYPNQLITKLHWHKNNVLTNIFDKHHNILTYTNINKKNKYDIIVYIDKFWHKDNIFYYKWKIRQIKELCVN